MTPAEEARFIQLWTQGLEQTGIAQALEYPPRERRLDFSIAAVYQYQDQVIRRPERTARISERRQLSYHSISSRKGELITCQHGSGYEGSWPAGPYTVDVYINGEKVTSGSFEIHE